MRESKNFTGGYWKGFYLPKRLHHSVTLEDSRRLCEQKCVNDDHCEGWYWRNGICNHSSSLRKHTDEKFERNAVNQAVFGEWQPENGAQSGYITESQGSKFPIFLFLFFFVVLLLFILKLFS